MKYPLRLGRKQQRAVLDADGIEIVVFPKGKEELALKMVEMFNNEWEQNQKDADLFNDFISYFVKTEKQ